MSDSTIVINIYTGQAPCACKEQPKSTTVLKPVALPSTPHKGETPGSPPSWDTPCGSCNFTMETGTLDGTLNAITGHPAAFPIGKMGLDFLDDAGTLIGRQYLDQDVGNVGDRVSQTFNTKGLDTVTRVNLTYVPATQEQGIYAPITLNPPRR